MSDDDSTGNHSVGSSQPDCSVNPNAWIRSYGDYLFNYAYLRVRDDAAAEDLVQETFLAALKSKENFEGESSERTWLVGILRHKLMDYFRRSFHEHHVDPESDSSELEKAFWGGGKWRGHWLPDRGPFNWGVDPGRLLEQKEFMEALDNCLKRLSPRIAGVFILSQMEELSTDEICKELGLTPTNVWVVLHRARMQLRRCLEVSWIGPEKQGKQRL
jgi:RNA polymerase sigma-70 factor (ECF subfamily)